MSNSVNGLPISQVDDVPGLTTALAGKADAAATTTALGLLAPKASPTFTGTPAAPTATAGTSTTQLATTAFVAAGLLLKADDSNTVHKTGSAQTVAPATTFTGQVIFSGSGTTYAQVLDSSSGNYILLGTRSAAGGFLQTNTGTLRIEGSGGTLVPIQASQLQLTGACYAGATIAGSANAQIEGKAADASSNIFAGYASDGTNPFKIGPAGKTTLPGRDGPIASDADAATITLNMTASDFRVVTLGGNRTLALSGDIPREFKLKLVQSGAGGFNPTWWSGITWYTSDGLKPTPVPTTGKATYVTFVKTGSGTYDGFLVAGQA